MLKELEKAIQDDLDKGFVAPRTGPTIVQQLLGVAESVKGAQTDLDVMQDEFNHRTADLLQTIHTAVDLLRDDMAERFEALRKNLGARP